MYINHSPPPRRVRLCSTYNCVRLSLFLLLFFFFAFIRQSERAKNVWLCGRACGGERDDFFSRIFGFAPIEITGRENARALGFLCRLRGMRADRTVHVCVRCSRIYIYIYEECARAWGSICILSLSLPPLLVVFLSFERESLREVV